MLVSIIVFRKEARGIVDSRLYDLYIDTPDPFVRITITAPEVILLQHPSFFYSGIRLARIQIYIRS